MKRIKTRHFVGLRHVWIKKTAGKYWLYTSLLRAALNIVSPSGCSMGQTVLAEAYQSGTL